MSTTKCSFSCGKQLDITQAEKLQKRLVSTLEKGCDIELNADQIERADTAGLQLLFSFCIAARHQGLKIYWKQPSELFVTSARRLGLATQLGIR